MRSRSHDNPLVKHPNAGDPVNLAAFARTRWWVGTQRHDLHAHEILPDTDGFLRPARDPQTGEWHLGLEWDEPRDVRRVVVRYADPQGVPPNLRVQYWQHNWPTPAPERRTGARRGWIGRDDPWHGQWVTVRAEKETDGPTCSFDFDPIDLPELRRAGQRMDQALASLDEAEHYLARFRRTLKVRLVSEGDQPPAIAEVGAFSAARWLEGEIDLRFGVGQEASSDWSGHAEGTNGYVTAIEPLDLQADIAVDANGRWRCRGKAAGIRLRVLYADCDSGSADHTVVTVRTSAHSFSFLVDDLNRGPVYILDYGVFVTWAGEVSFDRFRAQLADAPKSIYDRIDDEPEHSLSRALAEIPPLDVTKQAPMGRYLPLGVQDGRQEFALRYNGELFLDKSGLKLYGRDAARLLWPSHRLRFRFGTGDPPRFREDRAPPEVHQSVLDGWLPVVATRWLDREIEYEQTAFAALLDGSMTLPETRRGDENVATMLRFALRNTTHSRKRAMLWLAIAPQEQLELRQVRDVSLLVASGRVVPSEPVARQWQVQPYESTCLRCAVKVGGRGHLIALPFAKCVEVAQAISTALLYTVDLEGGEAYHVDLAFPFVSLTQEADWTRVAGLDYDTVLADVLSFWRGYVEPKGQMDVPDQLLSDFHKAARVHVSISADKDPVSESIVVPAATWHYGACGNEACWQITMLDQAGHHGQAEAYLETFLHTQGMMQPDGRFGSAEGALLAMNTDGGEPVAGGFAYNLDHGFIMECLANHYRLSGDRAWLDRVIPHLVAACDFIVRERVATKRYDGDGQPVHEWGLLPAGHLEDNPEWRHWFAVNAHAYAGLRAVAEVLAEVRHPEAQRLVQEAEAYRGHIRAAARRAMVEAPVVQLLDGTYVPHVPTRTSIRGREWGWFREAAYGALHLLEGGVFAPEEEEMTWVLKDLEDNLFVSREWGRPVDLERYWFSHGGVTIQPNLMDLGIDYLRRRQVKHALRALFNNYGVSLYPDVRAFTEHPVIELGHGVGPFYKSSDESKALVWLRAHLLLEEGDALHLAMGVPRAWFAPGQSFGVRGMASYFGPVTYRAEASAEDVVMRVDLAGSRPPRTLIVHVRDPNRRPIQSVTVNGGAHTDFDPLSECVQIQASATRLEIRVCLTGR